MFRRMLESESQISNPIKAAVSHGLVGSGMVALGATIMIHNVRNEALSVLIGGSITGAIAGTIGYCLPNKENASTALLIALNALETSISLASTLTAPLLGDSIAKLGNEWGNTVVNELIGVGVIGGSILGVTGLCVLGKYCSSRFFSQNINAEITRPAEALKPGSVKNSLSAANRV